MACVGLIDPDRGGVEGGVEIADGAIGREIRVHDLRSVGLALACREIVVSLLDGVLDMEQIRRGARLLERVCHDQRHGLAVIANLRANQLRLRAPVFRWNGLVASALRRRIAVRQHSMHARRLLRTRRVRCP